MRPRTLTEQFAKRERKAKAEGAAEERAWVVAWLRDGGSAQALCLADAIERGEHLKDDET